MICTYLQPTPQHSTTIQASRMQVQALKTELELKTKVLLMPVDACVRHAMHGNAVQLTCFHAGCMHSSCLRSGLMLALLKIDAIIDSIRLRACNTTP